MKLELTNIKKSFEDRLILDNVSFTIEEGELVSLIGPSGSGKSTLLAMIGGMLKPDEGDIKINGESIVHETGHISFMPQQDSLFPWRTILENVTLGQELRGEVDQARAKNMLKRAGLAHVIDYFPHELSGGMRQRVAFIRALLSPQRIICLDEPFSALDEFTRLDMQKWLLHMWEHHQRAILLVTHHIEEALFLSDKIIILSESPAKICEVITVPFPRPRHEEMLLTEEFFEWKRRIVKLLHHEG